MLVRSRLKLWQVITSMQVQCLNVLYRLRMVLMFEPIRQTILIGRYPTIYVMGPLVLVHVSLVG